MGHKLVYLSILVPRICQMIPEGKLIYLVHSHNHSVHSHSIISINVESYSHSVHSRSLSMGSYNINVEG